jgi:alpha-tubulin suppressor-like RCC1 family protein
MIRRLPLLIALGGCLSSPPSSVGDGGPSGDAAGGELVPCDQPEDCPDSGRERLCHCGSCAVRDPDCSPGPLRWVHEDGKDGACAPAPAELALGYQSTCVRWSDGRVSCWGGDCFGEIGDGGDEDCADSSQRSVVPRLVRESNGGPPFGEVLALTVGLHHVCALRAGGFVWCWGSNDYGKLGNGSAVARSTTPVQVMTDSGDPLSGIVAVAAGNDHTCALDSQGDVFCWGDNSYLQLGVSGISNRDVAAQTANGTGFERISSGGWHTCAVRADRLYCWGRAGFGQLGYGGTVEPGSKDAHLVQYEVDDMPLAPTVVGLGDNFSCSGTIRPAAWCWGSNMGHALGDEAVPSTPNGQDANSARAVMLILPALPSLIAAGTSFACMRLEDRSLYCWGANEVGQLGIGGASATPQGPTEVPTDTEEIAAGDDHVCAITAERTVLCWGGNAQGQLGNGGIDPSPDPAEVMDLCQ